MAGQTFKNERDAVRKLALAMGYKGAAGGWIYRPRAEHLTVEALHSGSGGAVPAEWLGHHVCMSWDTWTARYGARLAVNDDGRFYVERAEELYDANRVESSKVYAAMLDAMADGDTEKADLLRARHEGWKLRVFAAYDLARGPVKARR